MNAEASLSADRFLIPLLVLVGVAVSIWVIVQVLGTWRKHRKVREQGLPARAILLRSERTAMSSHQRPRYNHLLEVTLPDRPTYEVWVSDRFRDWNVRVFAPGLELDVRVDPTDAQRVAVMGPVVEQDLGQLAALLVGKPVSPPKDPVKSLADLQRLLGEGLITMDDFERKKAEILGRL
ncbi:SHOCT domain-containing protein [Myxococcus sp. K38C18041901]|uniref:SHOCT domain-containing protein n=1 Tax=Myxococcus guangdongensis TaxID=2906760 RepID=UPI0020A75AA7|nr:SHOCT domain-containing protein [Myxococcus guangdongensis]MCP3065508.1 SHOCT domain-containing protein [Myxococcus guangdongensis]